MAAKVSDGSEAPKRAGKQQTAPAVSWNYHRGKPDKLIFTRDQPSPSASGYVWKDKCPQIRMKSDHCTRSRKRCRVLEKTETQLDLSTFINFRGQYYSSSSWFNMFYSYWGEAFGCKISMVLLSGLWIWKSIALSDLHINN